MVVWFDKPFLVGCWVSEDDEKTWLLRECFPVLDELLRVLFGVRTADDMCGRFGSEAFLDDDVRSTMSGGELESFLSLFEGEDLFFDEVSLSEKDAGPGAKVHGVHPLLI